MGLVQSSLCLLFLFFVSFSIEQKSCTNILYTRGYEKGVESLSEQEIYKSILQKMLDETERDQIENSSDFIKKLSDEIKQSKVITLKK